MKRQHFLRTLLSSIVLMLFAATTWAEKITDYTKIVSGKTYYIGATTGGTDYYFSVDGSKATSGVSGTAVTTKSSAALFTFDGSGDSWTLKFYGTDNYLSLASSKANGKVNVVDKAATWTLSNIETKLRMSVGDYSLQKNNSGTQFGSYGNTQTDVWLEEYETGDTRTATELSWSAASCVATIGETNTFPTLSTTPSNLSGVTYSSSNTNVATISNTGAITLVAAGSTNITASFAGNTTYKPAQDASYALTVKAAQVADDYTHDVITAADLKATGTTYADFSGVTKNTAVYAGNSAKSNDGGIQLRSSNSNSGIVSTTSGGKIKKVIVTWNSNCTADRTLNIFASSSKYTAATDLYTNYKQGTKVGEIVYGTSNSYEFTGDYEYVGVRSSSGALIIDDIEFVWDESGESGDDPVTVTAPTFDVAAGKYTEAKTVKVSNYDSNNLYVYTLDGSAPEVFGRDIRNGVQYNHSTGVEISETSTLKMLAVDDDGNASNVTSATYTINIPVVYASLNALVADDITSGTTVTVSFENVPIKSIYTTTTGYRNGVYFDIQKGGKDIEIYFKNVPEEWVEGGTLSGTMTCPWNLYSGTWELAPTSDWAWTNLTYTAPTVDPEDEVESITISGTPTKLTYALGDKFDLSGLTVIAHHSINDDEDITNSSNLTIYVQAENYDDTNDGFTAYGTQEVYVYAYLGTDLWDAQSFYVTVSKKQPVINIAEIRLPKGEELTITATTEPEGLDLTYSIVSGESYITLNGDKLTGVAEGKATVKASFAGNDDYYKEEIEFAVNVLNGKLAKKYGFTATSGDFDNTSDITFEAFQGESATAPAANVSGNGCLRLYQNGGYVTVSGAPGVTIKEAYLYLGNTYDKTIIADTEDDEELDKSSGLEVSKYQGYQLYHLNCNKVTFYCLGTDKNTRLDIAKIEVVYEKADVKLDAITLSGDYKTDYIVGQEFSNEGMVVTASYTGTSETKVVTSEATFSGYNLSNTGAQTITVSFTDGDITKTATYTINVAMEEVESISLDFGEGFKSRYTVGETFSTDGIELNVTYNSGRTLSFATMVAQFSGYDMSKPGKQTVTVSYAGKTTTFDIIVRDANIILDESFDTNNGTGGNDEKWSGSIASNNLSADNEGWTFTKGSGANQCAKFGAGSTAGSAQTPALGCAGAVKITFKAAAWNGTSEATTLNILTTDGKLSAESVTLEKGAWNEYTIYAHGLTADSKITFAAAQASNNRFFLDEVLITRVSVADLINIIANLKHQGEGEEVEGIYTIDDVNEMRDALLQIAPTTEPEGGNDGEE